MLHDPSVRTSIEARLAALRPDAVHRWGTMTVDQMLWHVNQFLAAVLGEISFPPSKRPLPPWLMRFLVLHMPWPKSAPTNPAAIARQRYDFATEHQRCLLLIGQFASRPLAGPWHVDPAIGAASGEFVSRLQAKHLDHHLRQFGT
jgi:hypothetical protein